jgi:OOP family OmpA-OmpF porin
LPTTIYKESITMLRRSALTLSVLGLACASPPAVAPLDVSPIAPAANERVNVSHVYVVIDSSSSVDQDFPTEKAMVESFVGAMPDGTYEVAAIAFGGYERQTEGLKPFDRNNLKAGAANLEHLGEGTPLDRVISELTPATEGKFGRGVVIVFSDGVPTDPIGRDLDSEKVIAAAKQLKEDWQGELCFHTVQVGNEPGGAEFLDRLSKATSCGSSRTLSSIQNVAALQNYERELFLGAAATRSVAAAPSDTDADGVRDDKDECPGTPGGIMTDGRGCWVVVGLDFAFDSAKIESRHEEHLGDIVRVLSENPGIKLRIDGHTDSKGSEAYNETLSQRRADSVRAYLMNKGVGGDRLQTQGFGESRPAASNDSDEGRAKNRRTELTALEK